MKRAEKEAKTPMTKKRILLTIGAFCVAIALNNCGLKSKAQKVEESKIKTSALDKARQNYKEQLEKMSQNLSEPNKLVLTLLYMDGKNKDIAFKRIESNWSEIYLKRLIEVMLLTDQNTRKRIIKILETSTGKEFGARKKVYWRKERGRRGERK